MNSQIQKAIKNTKAYYCLDCGKCSSVCPISLLNEEYTPRLIVKKGIMGNMGELLKDGLLWSCLTCRMCNEICESDVRYAEFIRDIRIEAHKVGEQGICSHNGALHSLMRIMTSPELKQNRIAWVPKDLKISHQGEVLYFVGCLPYFDAFFTDLKLNTLQIAKDSIKILNHLGIEPVLMPNERCCGHDLLWTGDIENFKKLAQHNIEEIKKTGAKKIVFSCPEGYHTFKEEYPKYVGNPGVEVIHIFQLVSQKLPELSLRGAERRSNLIPPKTENRGPRTVTFQDPCRLGRFCGLYDEPRQIINAIPGAKLNEMLKARNSSICCGTSGWINCSSFSKQIQIARLKSAKSTGADTLITACPKCQIHFKCAISDKNTPEEAKIEIQDLTSLIVNNLNL